MAPSITPTAADSAPQIRATAIIVAAGSSRRMGFDKLTSPLAGIPVLRKTLDAFLAASSITEIVIVCSPARWHLINAEDTKSVKRVDGGANRQDSVMLGLGALSTNTGLVAVHDGARPLISPEDIDRCVAAAAKHRAASLARRVTETLKRSTADDFNLQPVSREQLWFMETPQVFEIPLLRKAYQLVVADGLTVTDEVSALEHIGVPVKFLESMHPNLKITIPSDLALAEALLK